MKIFEDAQKTIVHLLQPKEPNVESTGNYDCVSKVFAEIPNDVWKDKSTESNLCELHSFFIMSKIVKIAAIFLVLLGTGVVVLNIMNSKSIEEVVISKSIKAVDGGVDWLLGKQDLLGGWNVKGLGGNPEYIPALNGLALLALAKNGRDDAECKTSLRRAAMFLVKQQNEAGRFGDNFDGMMYNQGIATFALLETYQVTKDNGLRVPISRALSFMCSRQSDVGGWGYSKTENSKPNTSITSWQVQSLLLADSLGWQENRIAVRKGIAWMSGTVNRNGYFGYEHSQQSAEDPNTLTMMGAYCLLTAQKLGVPLNNELSDNYDFLSHYYKHLAISNLCESATKLNKDFLKFTR
jgi:hypothetical protein